MTKFGELLAARRRELGLSQSGLARLLCLLADHHTVTRHEISRWESTRRVPNSFWRAYVAIALGVPLADLNLLATAVGVVRGHLPERTLITAWTAMERWRQRTDTPRSAVLDEEAIGEIQRELRERGWFIYGSEHENHHPAGSVDPTAGDSDPVAVGGHG